MNIDEINRKLAKELFFKKNWYLPLWVPLYVVFIAIPYTTILMFIRYFKNNKIH